MKYKIKKLMQTDVSKIYIMGVIIFCLILLGSYFSYAMFTVNKEKNRAISIVTGTLEYELKVNNNETNIITVPGNSNATYTINLNNINSRDARLNFYYIGDLPSGVDAGYIVEEGTDVPPIEKGEIFSKAGSNGDKKVYKIKVVNSTSSSVNINLGVQIGLDYNDLSIPSNGHLFDEYVVKASDTIIENIGNKGSTYDDGTDTFITGSNPNNYVWYSGKLWRAVSINNSAKTIKLVTQWNMNAIYYSSGSNTFEGSYMKDWLNDTTVDGFLANLREPEKFIVMDAKWNATATDNTSSKPSETTIVESAVGLLNIYEYTRIKGYLNNGLYWCTLTPEASVTWSIYCVDEGNIGRNALSGPIGFRPAINLRSDVKIASGSGTESDPYRLSGDNDTDLNGVKLNTRYSGEYIRFGTDVNNLYRIVSHETADLTKITSAMPLKYSSIKYSSNYIEKEFNSTNFTTSYGVGKFLNSDFLNQSFGYMTNDQVNMIEDNTTWYLGIIAGNSSNTKIYKLAKYTNATDNILTSSRYIAKVGLLRFGELMAGQFERYSYGSSSNYWLLNSNGDTEIHYITYEGNAETRGISSSANVKPTMNLKENVVITGGDGTKNNPFTIELSS